MTPSRGGGEDGCLTRDPPQLLLNRFSNALRLFALIGAEGGFVFTFGGAVFSETILLEPLVDIGRINNVRWHALLAAVFRHKFRLPLFDEPVKGSAHFAPP